MAVLTTHASTRGPSEFRLFRALGYTAVYKVYNKDYTKGVDVSTMIH